ncbi:hypothetical protein [Mangrovimonas sp. YM274]|uniref:hypothetical protein n=1 Tax=Mangrovimonas sp. YM274 TaxID=3070660 RepID=UPI0027DD640E|nr:hypothetical protein [Mangrovimonas sp. YM274]WMI68831.1 hypothetical protein RBH95_00340 [Mangrovimonas sp. YM274]
MKKILYSTMIGFTFISSVNASGYNYEGCVTVALANEHLALKLGFSASEAYEMGSNAFDYCVDQKNIAAANEFNQ